MKSKCRLRVHQNTQFAVRKQEGDGINRGVVGEEERYIMENQTINTQKNAANCSTNHQSAKPVLISGTICKMHSRRRDSVLWMAEVCHRALVCSTPQRKY